MTHDRTSDIVAELGFPSADVLDRYLAGESTAPELQQLTQWMRRNPERAQRLLAVEHVAHQHLAGEAPEDVERLQERFWEGVRGVSGDASRDRSRSLVEVGRLRGRRLTVFKAQPLLTQVVLTLFDGLLSRAVALIDGRDTTLKAKEIERLRTLVERADLGEK